MARPGSYIGPMAARARPGLTAAARRKNAASSTRARSRARSSGDSDGILVPEPCCRSAGAGDAGSYPGHIGRCAAARWGRAFSRCSRRGSCGGRVLPRWGRRLQVVPGSAENFGEAARIAKVVGCAGVRSRSCPGAALFTRHAVDEYRSPSGRPSRAGLPGGCGPAAAAGLGVRRRPSLRPRRWTWARLAERRMKTRP